MKSLRQQVIEKAESMLKDQIEQQVKNALLGGGADSATTTALSKVQRPNCDMQATAMRVVNNRERMEPIFHSAA